MNDGTVVDLDEGMKDIPAEKRFIRFSIKADDTKENANVHEMFKEFCKTECDNNYTIGLRTLLTYYQTDGKFEAVWEVIRRLQEDIFDVKSMIQKPKEEKKEKEMF